VSEFSGYGRRSHTRAAHQTIFIYVKYIYFQSYIGSLCFSRMFSCCLAT